LFQSLVIVTDGLLLSKPSIRRTFIPNNINQTYNTKTKQTLFYRGILSLEIILTNHSDDGKD
jgi:hypothetical protein